MQNTTPRQLLSRGASVFFPLVTALAATAGETPPDSISGGELRSVNVVAGTATSGARLSADGAITLSAAALNHNSVRTLGETDMLRTMMALPGVNATSDYASGAAIDGSDQSQTLYRIAGAPVLYPYHFGGIFSTFSATHYPAASLHKSIRPTNAPNRLGAIIDFDPATSISDWFSGTVNVGMIASSATLHIPLSRQLSTTVSARRSYLNQLYPWLLKGNSTTIRYDLTDVSTTVNYHPTANDRITVNALHNRDRVKVIDPNYSMTTGMRWHNTVASAGWSHTAGPFTVNHTAYWSAFGNRLSIDLSAAALEVYSSVNILGLKGDWAFQSIPVKAGYSIDYTQATPQWGRVSGRSEAGATSPALEHSTEIRAYAQTRIRLTDNLYAEPGLSVTRYIAGQNYRRFLPDPSVTFTFKSGAPSFTVQIARRHQFIHCTGFSDIGLSSNFWSTADASVPEQSAWDFAANVNTPLPLPGLTASFDIYYKRISSQPEFTGQVIDLLGPGYNAKSQMQNGRGYNTGFDILLKHDTGRLNGWLSYAWCVARRKFPDTPNYVTSATELRHALTMLADYRLNERLNCSATFTLASGRPFTPIKAIYIIGENVIMEPGERNSSRLPLYHRLDLAATYRFATAGTRHFINLSILNAYGHTNVEMQSYTLDPKTGRYYLKQISSLFRFLPSVSYTLEF